MSALGIATQPLRLLAAPSHTLEELAGNPRWLSALLITSICNLLLAWFSFTQFGGPADPIYDEQLSEMQVDRVLRVSAVLRYAAIAIAPAVTMVLWFFGAFVLWLIAQVAGGLVRFPYVFSVMANASMVNILSRTLVVVLLWIRIQQGDGLAAAADIRLGGDLLIGDYPVHSFVRSVLGGINPFSVWFHGLLLLGLAKTEWFSWSRSAATVVVYWLFTMLFIASVVSIVDGFTGELGS
jgi:hypothetical protein